MCEIRSLFSESMAHTNQVTYPRMILCMQVFLNNVVAVQTAQEANETQADLDKVDPRTLVVKSNESNVLSPVAIAIIVIAAAVLSCVLLIAIFVFRNHYRKNVYSAYHREAQDSVQHRADSSQLGAGVQSTPTIGSVDRGHNKPSSVGADKDCVELWIAGKPHSHNDGQLPESSTLAVQSIEMRFQSLKQKVASLKGSSSRISSSMDFGPGDEWSKINDAISKLQPGTKLGGGDE